MPKLTDVMKQFPNNAIGIDVSSYQGKLASISWDKYQASGGTFAFLKASEGMTIQDSAFRDNYEALLSTGIRRGSYHFFRGGHSGAEQAENFLRQIEDLFSSEDLPPVIDVEAVYDKIPVDVQIDYILEWCTTVEAKLNVHPMIYTSLHVVRDLFKNTTRFGDLPLWVVDYRSGITEPRLPTGFSEWKIWQWGDKADVAGFRGPCDYDIFNGSIEDLDQFITDSHF